MQYNANIVNNQLNISYNSCSLVENLTISANLMREKNITYIPKNITSSENEITVEFTRSPEAPTTPEAEHVNLVLYSSGNGLIVSLKFLCNRRPGCYNYNFQPFASANLHFNLAYENGGITVLHNQNPWWFDVSFCNSLSEIPHPIGSATAKLDNGCVSVLPVANNSISSCIKSHGLEISTKQMHVIEIDSPVMSLCFADSPESAASGNINAQQTGNIITVPTKRQRTYPECFKGFGWCTWNAFYHDVTEAKICEKLDEFQKLGIKLKWLLIDDGWSQTDDGYLLSFKENREKFPNGLKGLIEKVKRDYGVEYVGVWHAYTGYWEGIKKDSELEKQFGDKLLRIANGMILPATSEENAYEFWSTWYSYLKEQGVDFVKTDNQSSMQTKFDGFYSGASGAIFAHKAHESAVMDIFGGWVINCMGSTYEDMVSRPYTMITRNSDDFFPDKPTDFCLHTVQNVYTAVYQDVLHCCDYDMFFSKHPTAVGSAMLRAISGGPVYVSDEIGGSDPEVLGHLCDKDGSIFFFDNAAKVTPDCFFVNCETAGIPLKVYNTCGKNIAVAAFGITPEKTAIGTLKLAEIPNAKGSYLAHDFFNDSYFVVDDTTEIPLSLNYNGYALYTLYPINENGMVSVGDKNFYAEGATKPIKTAHYKTFIN